MGGTGTCFIHIMKKFFISALILFLSCGYSINTMAEDTDIYKQRKELRKQTKEELEEKATKSARKEAKKYEKEGWMVSPGALPLEKQLDRAYLMQMEYDDEMFPKYIMAEAQSIGGNYDAAKMQALTLAKQNLAGQIQTEVTALIENTVANEQMDAEQAASLTRSVMASKNLISQSIGRVITVVEIYRSLKNNGKEVLIRIAYNGDLAKSAAKSAIKKDLEEKGEELHDQLDKAMGW